MKVIAVWSSVSYAVLLLCANLPQQTEAFNAIINSSPLTMWLYNYLRANDCLGLPICDLIDGSGGANVVETNDTTGTIDVSGNSGLTLGDLYDSIINNNNNNAVESGNGVGEDGTLGQLYDDLTDEDDTDAEDREINNDVGYYDGPDIILYPEETETTPTEASSNGILGAIYHELDLLGGNNRQRRNRRNLRSPNTN